MVSFPKIQFHFKTIILVLIFFVAVGTGVWLGIFNNKDKDNAADKDGQAAISRPSFDNTKLKSEDIKAAGVEGGLPPYFPGNYKDIAQSKVVKNYTTQAASTGLVQSVRVIESSVSPNTAIIYYGEYFERNGWVIQPVLDSETTKILSAQKGTVSAKVSAIKNPQNDMTTIEVAIIVDKTYESTQR